MATLTATNGKFPNSLLVNLGWPEADHLRLIPAASASINRLAAAFETHFGKPLYLSDAYRTYAQQVYLKKIKGKFAATPGTSIHGLGRAIDMASRINVEGSAEHKWMEVNGPRYGWSSPAWAQPGQSTPEPWHWEYSESLDRYAFSSKTPTVPAKIEKKVKTMVPFIQMLYLAYYGAAPSPDDVIYWAMAAEEMNWGERDLNETFLGQKASRGTVDIAYRKFLGRPVEEDEKQYTNRTGWTVRQVFDDISSSIEAKAKR